MTTQILNNWDQCLEAIEQDPSRYGRIVALPKLILVPPDLGQPAIEPHEISQRILAAQFLSLRLASRGQIFLASVPDLQPPRPVINKAGFATYESNPKLRQRTLAIQDGMRWWLDEETNRHPADDGKESLSKPRSFAGRLACAASERLGRLLP